jgi:hypothetical protein
MPEKSYSGIGISSDSQLSQSGIGIPAYGSVGTAGHGLVRHRPAIVDRQCGNKVKAKQSDRLQVDSSRLRDRKV